MSSNDSLRDIPFGVGAAAGAAAWLLSYLFTYIITSSDIQNSVIGQFTEIPTWKAVGWVFYNAHFADTIVDIPIVGGATNFIGGENGFTPLLFVIPPVLLLVAGLAVGRYAGGDDTGSAALAGATTTISYLLLSIVGVFLFATENVQTDLVMGILLTGVLYPVVFGAVGAVAASLTAGGSSPDSTSSRL